MSQTIEVYRHAGSRDGGELRVPLLNAALPPMLLRGRIALDDTAHTWERVDLTLDYRPDLLPGALVRVTDPLTATPWTGLITSVVHRDDGATLTTILTVRCPV